MSTKELVVEIVVKCAGIILPIVAAWVAVYLKKLLSRFINTNEKQAIANTVVMAVEQMYKDLHGEEKLTRAMTLAANMMMENGIKVTADELKLLIESAVGQFNEVFKVEAVEDITETPAQ